MTPIDAGDLRTKPGRWERATNAQQRALVRAYDEWAGALKRELLAAQLRWGQLPQLEAIVDQALPRLEATMLDITQRGIQRAEAVALRGEEPSVRVLGGRARHVAEGAERISAGLIPFVGERIKAELASGAASDVKLLTAGLNAQRSFPAAHAGGFWVMIFDTLKAQGQDENIERARAGLPPVPVRWVLDPLAEHCEPSAGFYGCPELAGEYSSWDALPTVPAGQVTCRLNCLLPGQSVQAAGLQGAMRSVYHGPALEFTTQKGFKLSVTPNHPILSPQGWLAAKFLRPGSDVISGGFSQRISLPVYGDDQNMPARIEQIWDAATRQMIPGRCRITLAAMPHDFYGDAGAFQGNVDVIRADGQLGSALQSPLFKQCTQADFFRRSPAQSSLLTQSSLVEVFGRSMAPSDRSMVSGDLPLPLFGQHLTPLQSFGLGLASHGDPLVSESSGNGAAPNARTLREIEETFASEITPDKVIQIRDFDYFGHVYDLQTLSGLYICNGIVVHNCRCLVEVWRDGRWQR